jgi:acyl-CoA reductase-like NAD-dependent aldehyde dehydrogenase
MDLRIVNPTNGTTLKELPCDDRAAIAAKVATAHAAQRAWAATSLAGRSNVVRRFRELLVERTETLALVLTDEVGKPIRQSKNELAGTLPRIDFFLEHAPGVVADEVVFSDRAAGLTERIELEPLGVVANISAWNYPWFVGLNVIVPALLTGNAVVYKPSEYATLTGLALADLLDAAGAPRGVFEVVVGAGEAGAALLAEPLDGVFFTGSLSTGRRVAEAAARQFAKLQLELGGKDPAYVCDDVEVDAAAAAVADGAFYNTGQSCCSVERVYVHAAIYDRFVQAFTSVVKGFVVGDPRDEATYIGPLTRRELALDVLAAQVSDATARGAKILAGGHRVERPGWYFEPTVLVDVDHSMRVMRDESFGPIIGIQPVADDAEAIEKMNDTEYGLTAGVYTADAARAERVLTKLAVGSAYVNCCDRVSPRLPWSGRRHSGLGCTLSTHGIAAFLNTKAWHVKA